MPFSVAAYIGMYAVQNKNLLERMTFVRRFFIARVLSVGILGIFQGRLYANNKELDMNELGLIM